MNVDFTFLLVMQHYPYYQHLQMSSGKDVKIEEDVADFLQTVEQQVSAKVLDEIYAYASSKISF